MHFRARRPWLFLGTDVSQQDGDLKMAGGAVSSGALACRLSKQKKVLQQRLLIRKAKLILHC